MKQDSNDIVSMFWSNIKQSYLNFASQMMKILIMLMKKKVTVFMIFRLLPLPMTMKKLRPMVDLTIATASKTSLLMKVRI
jgi:hypothetical protein